MNVQFSLDDPLDLHRGIVAESVALHCSRLDEFVHRPQRLRKRVVGVRLVQVECVDFGHLERLKFEEVM